MASGRVPKTLITLILSIYILLFFEDAVLELLPRVSYPWNPIRKRMYMRFQIGVVALRQRR